MTTPAWQAPISGAQTNLNATDASAHHNQFLGTHAITEIGYGKAVVTPTTGTQGYFTHTFFPALDFTDFAQQFTLTGTTIGRIAMPIKTFGNGADALFTLCPDNGSNAPNTAAPICQVKVPAAVFNATGAQLGLENATFPWQMAYNNLHYATNYSNNVPWLSPATTIHGAPSYFGVGTSGNYSLLLGGYDTVGGAISAACFSVLYTGAGTVANPIQQPSLPQGAWGAQVGVTTDTVVFMGGTNGTTVYNNVWAASWDSSTGIIGAWSSQVVLPAGVNQGAGANWGSHVYVIGGLSTLAQSSAVNTVYMSNVTNGQLGAWQTLQPLPRAVAVPFVATIGNWLVVAGGLDASSVYRSETYYAAINSDGSIGNWQQGPNLVQPLSSLVSNWCTGITDNSIFLYTGATTGGAAGSYIQELVFDASGPAPNWSAITANQPGTVAMSAFTDGNGVWYLVGYNLNNTAVSNFYQTVPMTSIPLYATGLTNGGKYWVVMQEAPTASNIGNTTNIDVVDFLGIGLDNLSYSLPAQVSNRHQNSWSTYLGNWAVPLVVYDNTLSEPIIHTVEDLVTGVQSAVYQKWTTFAYGDNNIQQGAIEVTMQPSNALNSNPTFTSGVSPWTATNGTITQSNAQTHGGFPFSGLLTPTGGFTSTHASSELIPLQELFFGSRDWYLVTGYFYSPTGTSNFSLSVNWYDSGRNYISTSSATVTLAANTWTQVSNWFTVPSTGTAAFAAIVPTEAGSPTGSNLIYISNCYMLVAPENTGTLTSIAQVNYQTGTLWPPVGVTQLN